MKKLNRRGFTLIELLAVIVIMAIIVVVTVPTIINTIADARVNSLWNLAKAAANTYDTMAAQDMLASDKVLEGIDLSTSWQSLGKRNSDGTTLYEILGLPYEDIVVGGMPIYAATGNDITNEKLSTISERQYDSVIRLKENGTAEIALQAKKGGKFDVSGKMVFAVSSENEGILVG